MSEFTGEVRVSSSASGARCNEDDTGGIVARRGRKGGDNEVHGFRAFSADVENP